VSHQIIATILIDVITAQEAKAVLLVLFPLPVLLLLTMEEHVLDTNAGKQLS
jgi:hypothetical protein